MTTPKRPYRGEHHYRSKLTEQDVLVIRQSDLSSAKLAERFGVCSATIRHVRTGRCWGHVPNRLVLTAEEQQLVRHRNQEIRRDLNIPFGLPPSQIIDKARKLLAAARLEMTLKATVPGDTGVIATALTSEMLDCDDDLEFAQAACATLEDTAQR